MSSIFLFIIFMAIITILQALKQGNNRSRQQAAAPRPVRPTMSPTVAPHRSPGSQNMTTMQSAKVQQRTETAANKAVLDALKEMDPEGVQTEGPMGKAPVQPRKMELEPEKEQSYLNIDTDDLQRSIVMTEILGKPKALRKN